MLTQFYSYVIFQQLSINICVKEHDKRAEIKIFVLTSVGIVQALTVTPAQVTD